MWTLKNRVHKSRLELGVPEAGAVRKQGGRVYWSKVTKFQIDRRNKFKRSIVQRTDS
jgi:hypothetical protein